MSDTGKPVLSISYDSQIGEPAKVLSFNEQGSLSKSSVDNFPVQGFTFSFWVKTGPTVTADILFSYDAANISTRLWVKNSANLEVGFGGRSTGTTDISINDNYWHHLAFTVFPSDSTHYGVQVYKDGVLMFENIMALSHDKGTIIEKGGKLEIGHVIEEESNFTGMISDFRLWNSIRKGKEIITDMQVRMNNDPALIIYWKLESLETSGDIVNGTFIDSMTLRFRNNQFIASWDQVTGATSYNLEVISSEYGEILPIQEPITSPQSITGYRINTKYLAKLQAVIGGKPGEWSDEKNIIVLNLQKTFLRTTLVDIHTLNADWTPVDQAESYTILQKNEMTGKTDLLLNQQGTTYSLTNLAKENDSYTFQIKAFSQGSHGTFSDVISFASPTIVFTCQNDSSGIYLNVSWMPMQGVNNYYIQVFKGSLDTPPVYDIFTDQGEINKKITAIDLKENEVYIARVRGIGVGCVGEWCTSQQITINGLGTPVTSFDFDTVAKRIKLQWTDIRTQQQKDAGLKIICNVYSYKNKSTEPFDKQTTEDLFYPIANTIMADNNTYEVKVQATAGGSYGNWSAVGQVNTPSITSAWYDYNIGKIAVQYTGINDAQGYLEVFKNQENVPDYAAFSDRPEPITYAPANASENDQYIPQIRGMLFGFITKYSENNPSVTIFQLIGPEINSATGSASNHSITIAWSFKDSTGISYNIELWNNSTQMLLDEKLVSAKTYTFQDDSVITDKNVYNVRVQAVKGTSLGRWSGFKSVPINALEPVSNIGLNADNDANICVSYSSSESGATYQVKIFINDAEKTTHEATSTNIIISKSETGVETGNSYDVKVQIVTIKGSETSTMVEKSQKLKIEAPKPPEPKPPHGGDPINLVTGSYAYSHCDLDVMCIEPLQFIAFYQTDVPLPDESSYYDGKPLGNRWNHSYNTRIALTPDKKQLYVIWGDDSVDKYIVPNSITGNYPPLNARRGYNLFFGSDHVFSLSVKNQYSYRFSSDGRLTSIISPVGNTVSLEYEGTQLRKIQLDAAHYLALDYNSSGFIKTVSDNAMRTISYEFQNNNLVSVTNVMGNKRTFEYYDKSLIKNITDENGHTFIQNVYDGNNRVISQKDAKAVSPGTNYGIKVNYTAIKENNLDMVVADYEDRSGCTARYKSYRTSNNLKDVTAQLGNGKIRKVSQIYDAFSNLLSETIYEGLESEYNSSKGNKTIYTYDDNNNVLTIHDALGQVSTYFYDSNNNLVKEVDILGNTTFYNYDGNLLKKITDPLQREMRIEYHNKDNSGQEGLISSITDVAENTFTFKYANGYLTEVGNPLGDKRTFENDSLGRVLLDTIIDASGNTLQKIKCEYYADGRCKKRAVMFANQPENEAFTTNFSYDPVGNLSSESDAVGNIMNCQYDPNDLLKKIMYPALGDLERETTYQFDKSDHLQQIIYSKDVIQQYQYDEFNQLLQFTDANGNLYTKTYEQNYLPNNTYATKEVVTYPLAGQSEMPCTEERTYDFAGRLIAVKSRSNQQTTLSYGKEESSTKGIFNRVVTCTLPVLDGQATGYTIVKKFDAAGRLIYVENEAGNATSIAYTVQNDAVTSTKQEVVTETDSLGIQKISVKDALGRVISIKEGKDSLWNELRYQYDALGRIISTGEDKEESFVFTKYTYRYDSATKHMLLSKGRPGDDKSVTTLEFNGLNQLLKETDPLNKVTCRAYTPWGNIHTYTNGRYQVLTYNYDAAGRFTGLLLPDSEGTITHKLDGNGNCVETLLNNISRIKRTFDTWNRMTGREDSENRKILYHFTPDDNVDLLTYSDSKQVRYAYDNLGRMSSVTDWNNRATLYQYDPIGHVQQINYPNFCIATLTFDAGGRLTGIAHKKDDIIIASTQYTLDALGNKKTCQSINPISPGSISQQFSATYNAGNQIISYNGQQLNYDDDGNLVTLPSAQDMATVTYDWYNRIRTINNDSYAYDEDGLRSSTTVNGITRKFVYDINGFSSPLVNLPENNGIFFNIFAEDNFTGTLAMVQKPESLLDFLDRLLEIRNEEGDILYRYVYGNGLVSQEGSDGTYRIYAFDTRGSVVALTDESGSITDRYACDIWGNLSNSQGNSFNPFLYNGIYGVFNDGNGLQYMRARSYAPHLGRFLQKDFIPGSMFRPQSLNRYAFVRGNPVSMIDPLGLFWKDVAIGLAVGLGIGLVVSIGLIVGGSGAIGGGAVGGAIGGVVGGVIAGPVGAVIGGTIGGSIGTGVGTGISTSGVTTTSSWFARFTSNIRSLFGSIRYMEDMEVELELLLHPHSA
ncbi:LamG-like jellyroll fold domain-containing protein [Methanosarcina sp. Z-7115]|uniref:LamG-like jellyroll fold domain-containing protein n=1 Tax=Methanosarcina baikalica TaxID=3073890 RepID=A0ABU2D2C0_9EURY|nr:LamG-like jellyroll fold domain-containing protein [Methanosarcina sp. Z-7115]MDR7666092.1 LamG-like jellyroll fold domain-containing protein [Methanosarcina sp. Z-7115]